MLTGPIESSAHRSPTTPNAFKTAGANPAIHSILFQLRSKGVSLVGMRMVWMTRPQATQVLKMIGGGGGDNNTNAKHEHYVSFIAALELDVFDIANSYTANSIIYYHYFPPIHNGGGKS